MLKRIVSPVNELRWLAAKNGSGVQIPAYGVCAVMSFDGRFLTVGAPISNGQTAGIYFNGPSPMVAGGSGAITKDMPWYALYEPADGAPAVGQQWGAENGKFKLRAAYTGYTILSAGDGAKSLVEMTGPGTDVDASATQDGDVSLSDQYLGSGIKTVDQLAVPITVAATAAGDPTIACHLMGGLNSSVYGLVVSSRDGAAAGNISVGAVNFGGNPSTLPGATRWIAGTLSSFTLTHVDAVGVQRCATETAWNTYTNIADSGAVQFMVKGRIIASSLPAGIPGDPGTICGFAIHGSPILNDPSLNAFSGQCIGITEDVVIGGVTLRVRGGIICGHT